MWGVVRYVDTDLLPASAPKDFPKIIKSGIDEEGQNVKSPQATAQDGIATFLYRAGRLDILERLLDVKKYKNFDLRIKGGEGSAFQDIYLKRNGYDVEVGFQSVEDDGTIDPTPAHGVRYVIMEEEEDEPSPYRFARWLPLSTSDLGSAWGGTPVWVRAQGEAIPKAIWFLSHWDNPFEVSWTGITEEEKTEFSDWLKVRREEIKLKNTKLSDDDPKEPEDYMVRYRELRKACRADCGETNAKLRCSKCHVTRYCSPACQADDWKYHKTYCGEEEELEE